MQNASATWLLRLGDDALVLAQRLSEWCGHGPALEEDIALSNIALDLLGQSRAFLTLAGEREGKGRDEDTLAYFRTDREFSNLLLLELPNGHFGDTIMRQCLFDQFAWLRYEALAAQNVDLEVAAIASKALKEVKYHAAHSAQWVIRLGDGTEESHQRIQQSLDDLWAYTGEFFMDDEVSTAGAKMGLGRLNSHLQPTWSERIQSIMEQATLRIPDTTWMHKGGRQGKHTEHLSYMLAEMQVLQRTYPGAQW
jgi:ring-1,2-phenylacetyl-CoA epoxidase subunit PaaC